MKETYSANMKLLWGKNHKSHKCDVLSNIVWCEIAKEVIMSLKISMTPICILAINVTSFNFSHNFKTNLN
jgi:hypothetical protein